MITPIEIRQQTFKKALRGYDKEEVHAYLTALSQEWERHLEAHRAVKEERDRIQSSYNTLKEVESMLHKTLMQAEQSSRDTMENARQKADLKLQEAEVKAIEIIRQGKDEREALKKEIVDLSRKRDQLLVQLQGFLKTQLDFLNTFELSELPPAPEPPKALPQTELNGTSHQIPNGQNVQNGTSNGADLHKSPAQVEEIAKSEKKEVIPPPPKAMEHEEGDHIFTPSKNGHSSPNLMDDIMAEL